MRRLSARSEIFVQSSFGPALALKALLLVCNEEYLGIVEGVVEEKCCGGVDDSRLIMIQFEFVLEYSL